MTDLYQTYESSRGSVVFQPLRVSLNPRTRSAEPKDRQESGIYLDANAERVSRILISRMATFIPGINGERLQQRRELRMALSQNAITD